MAARPEDAEDADELVDFFLKETGETLQIVVEYTADEHTIRYADQDERPRLTNLFDRIDEFLDQFRHAGRRNAQWEQLLQVGDFYVTLHLFDSLLLMHFSQPDGHGVIFGYDPRAAPNLTDFISLVFPHLRRHGFDDIGTPPTW